MMDRATTKIPNMQVSWGWGCNPTQPGASHLLASPAGASVGVRDGTPMPNSSNTHAHPRYHHHQPPHVQVGFITFIIAPLYTSLFQFFPEG